MSDRTSPELERLRAALHVLNWDAAELAYRLQVKTATIRGVLNGHRPVHPNLLAWAERWAAAVAPLPRFPEGWVAQADRAPTQRTEENE